MCVTDGVLSTGVMMTVCCHHKQVITTLRAQLLQLHTGVVCVHLRRLSQMITSVALQLLQQQIPLQYVLIRICYTPALMKQVDYRN